MMNLTYSVCNELFGKLPLPEAARIIRESGYSGIEFAPFTIFGDFTATEVRRGLAAAREVLDGEGLAFAGFHWLLAKPEGLHLASPDRAIRKRSAAHLEFLAECAGELGGGPLILGSPRQRGSLPGVPRAEAEAALAAALRGAAGTVAACGCSLLLESLSPEQTDVVNTLGEAVRLARAVESPAVSSMFDFRNASCEAEPWDVLLDRYYGDIRHVHANEIDGRAPGTGVSDYLPSFRTLLDRGYRGWVSVEIFEVPEDPGLVLRGSMELFKRLEELGGNP